MTYTRTQEQIAFDGVRLAWHGGAVVQSLSQVTKHVQSMDGIVRTRVASRAMQSALHITSRDNRENDSFAVKVFQHVLMGLDGIRVPVGRTS